jgi:hypothetical protein
MGKTEDPGAALFRSTGRLVCFSNLLHGYDVDNLFFNSGQKP